MNAAKILNAKIKKHPHTMAWPLEEKDLGPDKVVDFIPKLLDIFCTILCPARHWIVTKVGLSALCA